MSLRRSSSTQARCQGIVTILPKYACPKGRTGIIQAKAPAHLLERSWPTEALLAHVVLAKHPEHVPLNRQNTDGRPGTPKGGASHVMSLSRQISSDALWRSEAVSLDQFVVR